MLDVDRTTLICFLLFFSSGTELPPEEVLSRERLDNILEECGFTRWTMRERFDDFILYYMEAEDPASYLVDEVMRYAQMEKKFSSIKHSWNPAVWRKSGRSWESDIFCP